MRDSTITKDSRLYLLSLLLLTDVGLLSNSHWFLQNLNNFKIGPFPTASTCLTFLELLCYLYVLLCLYCIIFNLAFGCHNPIERIVFRPISDKLDCKVQCSYVRSCKVSKNHFIEIDDIYSWNYTCFTFSVVRLNKLFLCSWILFSHTREHKKKRIRKHSFVCDCGAPQITRCRQFSTVFTD